MVKHPGVILWEEHIENKHTLGNFAKQIQVAQGTMGLICKGKRKVTDRLAANIAEVTGTDKQLWIDRQEAYQKWLRAKVRAYSNANLSSFSVKNP